MAFARLLVRDVRVVVLDEATARMDPVTEAQRRARRGAAARRPHRHPGRPPALHDRARRAGRGPRRRPGRPAGPPRAAGRASPGPFRTLLEAAAEDEQGHAHAHEHAAAEPGAVGTARRTGEPPPPPRLRELPGLTRATVSALLIEPQWGVAGMALFLVAALTGAFGALTGWIWGHLVVALQDGGSPVALTAALVASLLVSPLLLAEAFRRYPRWWIAVMLRVRTAVLAGQTDQHRLERTPPGEVVARTMDADRLARYADRWVDFINGLSIVAVTALAAQSCLPAACCSG